MQQTEKKQDLRNSYNALLGEDEISMEMVKNEGEALKYINMCFTSWSGFLEGCD